MECLKFGCLLYVCRRYRGGGGGGGGVGCLYIEYLGDRETLAIYRTLT